MEKNLRVAFVSAEVSPYAKLGEMADVAYSLPKHLSLLGMKVCLFMPKYRRPEIDSLPMEQITSNLVGSKSNGAIVLQTGLFSFARSQMNRSAP